MSEARIRKIIHSYALIFRYHFMDELILQPNYLMTYTLDSESGFFNCAMNLNATETQLDAELMQVERYYTLRQKIPVIAIESSTSSVRLVELLESKGYKKSPPEETCVMWARKSSFAGGKSKQELEFRIVKGFDDFQDYLDTAAKGWEDVMNYSKHAASLSKLYQHPHDGTKIFHIVGYVNNTPVCTSTLGIYFDMAHLINLSVVPSWRKRAIASEMISYASQIALTEKASEIYVCINETDKHGTALLLKNHFTSEITQSMYIKHAN